MTVRFELFVQDTSRSAEFYERSLGFTAARSARSSQGDYREIVNGAVHIGLCAVTSLNPGHYFRAGADERSGIGVEIVLEVDDISAYERQARLTGAIFEPMQHRPWGLWDFRVLDPDGYYIRVTEASACR